MLTGPSCFKKPQVMPTLTWGFLMLLTKPAGGGTIKAAKLAGV